MVNLMNQYLFAKGTCNVVVRDIATGDVDYQSNKVQTSQFTTTADMGAIQAGIGNATAIQLPHNAAVNLTLTNADFNMSARAMSVGSKLNYGGIAPVCEVIEATGNTLSVTKTPAAPYGYLTAICNVVESGVTNAPGTSYTIDVDSKQIQGFTAVQGKSYVVTYFSADPSSQYFTINGVFAPAIKHVTVQISVYSNNGSGNAMVGTKVGDLYIIIPRMQFNGKADTDGTQTNPVVTDLSGTALTYDEAAAVGVCTDCAVSGLAQLLYVPAAGTTSAVQGMAVIGGQVTLANGTTKLLPIKWVMPDGSLQQPDYTAMTYTVPEAGQGFISVNAQGEITASGEGSTTVTAVLTDNPDITCVTDVTVTA